MQAIDPLAIVFLAGLIQASFQLSISVMVTMSGHALGRKTSHRRVAAMTAAFSFGVLVMVMLLLSALVYYFQSVFPDGIPRSVWGGVSGLSIAIGIAVWVFYYRYGAAGTTLWVPRAMADHLSKRARATTHTSEAFSLGVTSVLAELLFTMAPLLIMAGILSDQTTPDAISLGILAFYGLTASAPLLIITMLVGGGHSLARIQRWRETNKRFLQFAAGSALIILGFYVYVSLVLGGLVG